MPGRTDTARPAAGARYDVAVAGGGAVGATLACALADSGSRVLLADPSAGAAESSPAFAPRPLALSLASQHVLASLGVWEAVDSRATPIESIHVSEAGRFGAVRLEAAECGVARFGSVAAADVLGTALRDAVARRGVHRQTGAFHTGPAARRGAVAQHDADRQVAAFPEEAALRDAAARRNVDPQAATSSEGAALHDAPARRGVIHRTVGCIADASVSADRVTSRVAGEAGGESFPFSASLLVVADGGRSELREALGIGATVRDYRQHAIASVVTARAPHARTAFERFTPGGPVALLPMGGTHYGLVWCCGEDEANRLAGLPERDFAEALDAVFAGRLGGFASTGERVTFPLKLVRARHVVADRTVLIGNAANHLHPVAGQGFNLGMRDVACLAEAIVESRREGCGPGDASTLERYRRWRAPDHAAVARFTDALVGIFGHRCSPLAPLRAPALAALDRTPPLKRALARHAMGFAGRTPRLALGQRP